ncbi:MAG: hypothetical protein QM655_12895 [Nocardioidaceae bacterium]
MNKAALAAIPLAMVLFFPLMLVFAVASVGGLNLVDCTTAGGGSGAISVGTLNWRGASHYKSDPHPGEQPYAKRVPNMVAKVNESGASIIGFQEFESVQAKAFLAATGGTWALARGRVHGDPDTRDAIAYQPAAWTVAETRYLTISYGGTPTGLPLVRFTSTSGLGDLWVLNTHNPANVVGGTSASRDDAVRDEAATLKALAATGTPVVFTGDMNDAGKFSKLFLNLAGPGWSAANPISAAGGSVGWGGHIDWIVGGPGITFSGTVTDKSTNDGAHAYTDHPFVYTTLSVAGAAAVPPSAAAAQAAVTPVQPAPDTSSDGGCQCPLGGASDTIALTSASDGPNHDAEIAAAAAYQAGFRGSDLYTIVWIAGGESSYNTRAINHYSAGAYTYYVYGLWQISSIHAGVSAPGIYDPLTNARQAFALYVGRGGSKLGDGGAAGRFDSWSAHTAANKAKYGPTATAAITAVTGGASGASAAVPAVATCTDDGGPLPVGTTGAGNFTPNTSIAYVGPYSPGQLVARMQKIMALNGSGGNLDPFFGTEGDGSWYNDCQHFVANLDGRASSGYRSASMAWRYFLSTGAAHPAGSSDGMSPPAGAWLYYGDNHVVVYLGSNLVAGTDTWGVGTAKIGPAADVQKWLASQGGYKGWVVPWGAPVKSSTAA